MSTYRAHKESSPRTSSIGRPLSSTCVSPAVRGLRRRAGRSRNAACGTFPIVNARLFWCNVTPSPAELAALIRSHPGLRGKAAIGLVREVLGPTDWLTGPGDDAAAVADCGGRTILAGGEALWPPFVATDPFGAGVAAVLANVNDLAAMGAHPKAILDTVIADAGVAREVLAGIAYAARLYGVRVSGGHLTVREGHPAVSAFGVGEASAVLSTQHVAPGLELLFACCLDGTMRADFPFFASLEERGDRLAGDVLTLAATAEAGDAGAAKDVSMAGLVGSLGMLLESRGAGAM